MTLRTEARATTTTMIPFNQHPRVPNDERYVRDALASGHCAGDGQFTRRASSLLAEVLGVPRVLLTTSCTHALEMSALLLDVRPGDEVIVPSFTFVSTVNAFVLRGATPVFCDVRPDTLNMDERLLPALVTPQTKVVVPVHYAGVGCEMDTIVHVARRVGAAVVEDNAHGLFAQWRGKALGTFGQLATQSFHETKNFSCGEGGALVVNDASLVERAEIIREKGTNRSRFFRGQVDKYTWCDVGSSFLPSDILAALLVAQFEARDAIQERRRDLWERYARDLAGWAARTGARLPCVPEHVAQSFHMFYLLLPTLEMRQALIAHLRARNVNAVFHYLPLHLSEMGRRYGGRQGQCPVTEDVSDRLLRLPMFFQLSDEEQSRVLDAVGSFQG